MSSPALTLLGVTLVLAGLIGVLVVAVIRLRGSMRAGSARPRVSEDAFMAAAVRDALAGRPPGPAPSPARPSSADAAIVSDLPAGILAVRQGGIVPRANPAALRILRLEPTTPLPARTQDLLAAHPPLAQAIERGLASRTPASVRLELPGPDGTLRAVAMTLAPMTPEAGVPPGVLVLLADITDAERAHAIDSQRTAMARMAHTATGVVHELANSLTGILGYARMIEVSRLDEVDRATFAALQAEIEALGWIVDGFRRITRPLSLTRETIAVRWLVGDAVTHVVKELQLASDAVSSRLPEGLEIVGDRILLEEALMHLLRNALEASTDAGIRPDVCVTAHATGRGAAVALVVEDNGPGVPAAERERLFEPFFSTKPHHHGLGLARARHIAQSHDGTLTASTPEGVGLTVTMTVPLPETATPLAPSR